MFDLFNSKDYAPSYQTPKVANLYAEFSRRGNRKKYVLGRNIYAKSLIDSYQFDAVIDDFTEEKSFYGLPVIRASECDSDCLVLNAAGGSPLSAKRKLDALGVTSMDYFSFFVVSGRYLKDIRFNEGFQQIFDARKSQFFNLYSLFGDDLSRTLFQKAMGFRYFLDIDLMRGIDNDLLNQYFDPLIGRVKGATFYDIGGFDGYTSINFIKRFLDYAEVHVFEPDPVNFEMLQNRLLDYPRITLHNYGLGSFSGTLSFDSRGSESKVCSQGGVSVEVKQLDTLDISPPSFVKVDVEGAELDVLRGARKTFKRAKPHMAIACYHYPDQMLDIVEYVTNEISSEYDIFFRHYTESIYESVLYLKSRSACS